ncbi:MAG: Do family serine endopeptidase [Alphaproteobacteria bacterium]|nr:Do family serine endopeptidase [Alphaproteobacteria bacterium]
MASIIPGSAAASAPRARARSLVVAALLAGTVLGGSVFAWHDARSQAFPPAPNALATHPGERAGFARLVSQVKPAVVTIAASGPATAEVEESDVPAFPPGSPFNDMLRRFLEQQGGAARARPVRALGSGFVIDPDGYIVTNNHVVSQANTIMVRLEDEREFPARLVGRDARSDLALLKIDAPSPLPAVALGDSDTAQIGDWVIAVGNPFGLGGTVTAGIVSARGRDIGSGPDDQFIQVDAPINRGNSGGPLFDQDGKVIGVNTAIVSPSGGSVGIGFAVPSNVVKRVVADLRANGHVDRGWLGVSVQALTPDLAKGLASPVSSGALVAAVSPDSPAAHAGLQAGDVVTAIDDRPIASGRELAREIGGARAGTEIALKVVRAGQPHVMRLRVGTDPASAAAARTEAAVGNGPRLGVVLAPLSPDLRRSLKLGAGVEGVVIDRVQPGSAADQAGLRPGDVVTAVAGAPVRDPDQAGAAIREGLVRKDRPLVLQVRREGGAMFVAIPTPSAAG